MGENSIAFSMKAKELPPSLMVGPATYPREQPVSKETRDNLSRIIRKWEHDSPPYYGQRNQEDMPDPPLFADAGTSDPSRDSPSSAMSCGQNNGGHLERNKSAPTTESNTRRNDQVQPAPQGNQTNAITITITPGHQPRFAGRLPDPRLRSIRISTRTQKPTTPVQASGPDQPTTVSGADPENAH